MTDIAQLAAAVEEGRKIGLAQARAEQEASKPAFEAPESKPVEFLYYGVSRKVIVTQISKGRWTHSGYNALLGGIEVERDGVPTSQFKKYVTEFIRPL